MRQRAASLIHKPHDDHEETLANGEKPRNTAKGDTDMAQDGALLNRQGVSRDNMV